ncbi:MarR family transcriptional regulator [Gordonia sp. CPCC 205515]|uniref:MarR family winged helix-turn-helix transcriptional regulator n=1 Tax=Gordonia sp. CPCC 205515 TaxID=3140791 RepID=UPI003AF3507F
MNPTVPADAGSSVPTATEVWFAMNSLVRDQAKSSRDRISAVIDIPFSRFRALRRIAVRDLTQRELAERLGVDAPAASGIVNDLVERGLATRRPHPTDGRCKLVTITEEGRRAVAAVTEDPATAPPMFAALDATQLRTLADLLESLRVAADG